MSFPGVEQVPSGFFDQRYDGSKSPTITEGRLEETGMLGFNLSVASGSSIFLPDLRTKFVPAVEFKVPKCGELVGQLGLYKVIKGMPRNDADQIGIGMLFNEGEALHLTSLAGPLGERFHAGAEYGRDDTAYGLFYLRSLHGANVSRRHLRFDRPETSARRTGIVVGVEDISENGTVFTALTKDLLPASSFTS
jgi:hypothetical protein